MKIGILQAGHSADDLRRDHGDFDAMFARLLDGHGFDFTAYAVTQGDFPQSAQSEDGWLITGSRFGTYEGHPWIEPLEAFIRDIFDAGRPMVGICFGHQIIATALGGRNEKFTGGWAVGHQVYTLANGQPRAVMAWHQDQVTKVPQGAQVVGRSEFCQNAFLLYPGKAYTMQPHPEFDAQFTRDLMDLRRDTLPETLAKEADARMDVPLNSRTSADEIAHFLKTATLP